MINARHDRSLILILAACSTVASMATNFVLPALPEIRAHFHSSMAAVQSMLSVYMVSFACSILVVGPLSDRIGRRPVLIGGLSVFALGSLLATVAPSLPVLILARVVQAMGATAAFIISRAVVGDLYEGAELTRRIATLTMVAVLATTAAPFLGGLVTEAGGWHGPFFVLTAFPILLALFCMRFLPETRTAQHLGLPLSSMITASRRLLAKPEFLTSVLQSSLIFSIFMVFVTSTPHIMEGSPGHSATDFGLYYMLISCGYFLGNFQVSRLPHGPAMERATTTGLWIQLGSSIAGLALVAGGLIHPLWLFGSMVPLAVGQGLTMPNVTAKAVSLAPGYAGIATSLLMFAQQSMSAVSVQAMGWASTQTAVPVMWYCVGASVVALVPLLLSRPVTRGVTEL